MSYLIRTQCNNLREAFNRDTGQRTEGTDRQNTDDENPDENRRCETQQQQEENADHHRNHQTTDTHTQRNQTKYDTDMITELHNQEYTISKKYMSKCACYY